MIGDVARSLPGAMIAWEGRQFGLASFGSLRP